MCRKVTTSDQGFAEKCDPRPRNFRDERTNHYDTRLSGRSLLSAEIKSPGEKLSKRCHPAIADIGFGNALVVGDVFLGMQLYICVAYAAQIKTRGLNGIT